MSGRWRSVTASVVAGSTACLLAVAGLVAMATDAAFDREQQLATSSLRGAAASQIAELASIFASAEPVVASVAEDPGITSFDPDQCERVLAPLSSVQASARVVVLDPSGEPVCSLPDGATVETTAPELFDGARAGEPVFTDRAFLDPGSGQTALAVALPATGERGTGAVLVVLFTANPPLELSPDLDDRTVAVAVDTASDLVLATTDVAPYDVGEQVDWAEPPAVGPDGVERLWQSVAVPDTAWRVVAGLETSVALASAHDQRRALLLWGLAILALVVGLAVALQRRLARPIRRLGVAIAASGHEHTAVRAPESGPTEVADVARAFNRLVADHAELAARLRLLATHDPLTGLPNRRAATELLEQLLADPAAEPLAVLFVDLDRFKLINDSHGHTFGDRLLVTLARRLCDAVPERWVVTRFGGDEFVVLCPATTDPLPFAEGIGAILRSKLRVDSHEVTVGGSIGIAVARPGEQAEDLLREADTAMYRAKATGSGGVALFDDAMRAGAVERMTTERDLQGAAERGELVLHHQPVIDLATGEVVATEALVRWAHPERGLLPPSAFVPLAEETGLIVEVGAWVARQAAEQAATWRRADRTIRVSVNVAAAQLVRADLVPMIASVVGSAGCHPGDLVVEVTESAVLTDLEAAVANLAALRRLGVGVAIDDFGTGFSSLAYLQRLPADEVKLDRSFVAGVADSEVARTIASSVIELAHGIGLRVVAEGVEEVGQLAWLRSAGCDRVQGFLLARPALAEDLELGVGVG